MIKWLSIIICIVFSFLFYRDLYGAIGFPLKLSRTVIVGKKADLVKKILFVLSYFIRCSDILETMEVSCLETYLEKLDFSVESPCDSTKTLPACMGEDDNLTSSPTPVNNSTNQFTFDTSQYNPLCLNSLISNAGSNVNGVVDKSCDRNSSAILQTCDMCRQKAEKVGKSVFYVNSEPCSCDTLKGSNSYSHLSISSLDSDRRSEIQKKKESLKLGIKIPPHKSLQDSSLTSVKSCKLSNADIVEDLKIERMGLGRNCVKAPKLPTLPDERIKVPGYDIKIPENVDKVLTMDEIRKIFRVQGSNSMFDEYFEDGNEIKTIDEINEKGANSGTRIRFASQHSSFPEEDQLKTPSLPDLRPCGVGDLDPAERLRLGSIDQVYNNRQRKSSLSRQISETSKGSGKSGPGRCR